MNTASPSVERAPVARRPYTRAAQLPEIMRQRIVVLDGAMGTMIQRYKLGEADYRGTRFAAHGKDLKGNNELLQLTKPDVIREIHEQYLAAGADLIETNTFGATTVAQEDYDLPELAIEMNLVAARMAREACDKYSTPDKPRFAAGAIGPTPKTASISPDVNDPGARNVDFDTLRQAYYEQAKALMDGGCDVFLVETIFDTLNAKAAIFAIDELFEDTGERLPIIISGTVTDAFTTMARMGGARSTAGPRTPSSRLRDDDRERRIGSHGAGDRPRDAAPRPRRGVPHDRAFPPRAGGRGVCREILAAQSGLRAGLRRAALRPRPSLPMPRCLRRMSRPLPPARNPL